MTTTTPGVVEQIVARCLLEPAFLEALRSDPAEALRPYPLGDADRVAFQTADLGRLRHFSGFIGKVQHNFLWESFPASRKLLCRHGLELEVFARYRAVQLAPETRRAAQSEKIRRFLAFLEDFLEDSGGYPALHVVVRHERAMWETRQAAVAAAPRSESLDVGTAESLSWRPFSLLVPRIDGALRIETFDCDPIALTNRVVNDEPLRRLRRRLRLLVYWADRSGDCLRTLAIEKLSALLLSRVDGHRRVKSIVAALRRNGLEEVPAAAFRPLFEDAAREGLISLSVKDG